ncbi:MAG: hydrogenase iron-sulfur subunit [Sulfuritalea sp.]|nr:hydrogenase iron-sulfur subunit [Sulfuritalea sp.]MDP1983812.1 hydrogenase iron-sulfur subunit [Sulfuritalea sp.]
MNLHAVLRGNAQTTFEGIENFFDGYFGGADNPLRHLGALGLYFLWILVASGLYLYTVLDTSIDGAYRSIDWLSRQQWYLGGILRSLHRYAADAFVLVMLLHLLREWAYGRYHGFRLYSWVTGVPLIWLAYISGIGGYWIVWDRLAQFSAVATTELLDWLPIFSAPAARNFLAPDSISDRFFTVLVFIHIGVPLMLILGLWAHVNRISRVDYLPSRRAMLATMISLLALALLKPALSDAPADLALVPAGIRLDWFILFIHPLTDMTSAAAVWALTFGTTILLFALPFLPHPAAAPIAVVDAANCNGCARCHVDCPYEAITMAPHPHKPNHRIAIVDADHCAACGICAGACPSSTPFRSQEKLVTGIDMPQLPVDILRQQLEAKLARLSGKTRLVVFGCDAGADVSALAAADTATLSLICTGMLPPSFIEYALRSGVDGIVVTGCRDGGCEFRLGMEWTRERLARRREPHLRDLVPLDRIHLLAASRTDAPHLADAVAKFRTQIEMQGAQSARPPAFSRRTIHHA